MRHGRFQTLHGNTDRVRACRDYVDMGCGGVLPNWDCAIGALRDGGPALSVAFEICSAMVFMGNALDLVVSNSIFGDGPAAAVLDMDGATGVLRVLDFESGVSPRYCEDLPGGKVVLNCVARAFRIGDDLLLPSRSVFAEYENMSSTYVLFCLKKILMELAPRRGELGLLFTFGASFTSFAALVEFGSC